MIGNQNNPVSARTMGVRTARDATGQSPGQSNVVNHVIPAEWVVVNYNNERGVEESALYLKLGDQYYATADTVQWCKNLRPMTDWIRDQLVKRERAAAPVILPKEDAVDVMDGDEENE